MREIKFRVWDIENKEMLEPDLVSNDYMVFGDSSKSGWECIGVDDEEEETHIIMQYTGLKDKNGKEIWEGDIVKFPNDGLHTIEFPQDYLWCETQQKEIEVIGNIYENPELLNV